MFHVADPISGAVAAAVTFALVWIVEWYGSLRKPSLNGEEDLGRFPVVLWLASIVCAAALAILHSPALPAAWAIGVAAGAITSAAVIDGRTAVVPNTAFILVAIAGVLDAIWTHDLLGPVTGVGFVAFVLAVVRLTGAWRIAGGDLKLALAAGLVLTGILGAFALIVALLLALAVSMVQRSRSRLPTHGRVRFGPFLAWGAFVVAAIAALSPTAWALAFRSAP